MVIWISIGYAQSYSDFVLKIKNIQCSIASDFYGTFQLPSLTFVNSAGNNLSRHLFRRMTEDGRVG